MKGEVALEVGKRKLSSGKQRIRSPENSRGETSQFNTLALPDISCKFKC